MDSPPDNSVSSDWQGLGDLISLAADRLTTPVRDVHHAITDRWSTLTGPLAQPTRQASRAITTPIYESIRLTGSGLGRAVRFFASTETGSTALQPLWDSRRGSGVQAFFNGIWGDELDRQESNLSIEMGLRSPTGEPIPLKRNALRDAFPNANGRLVVLLHGLGDTEDAWQGDEQDDSLAQGLTNSSFTPLLVRYNSGLNFTRNGELLSEMLEEVVEIWPVEVDDISLVGHSMGGLVARNTLQAADSRHEWTEMLRHVVTLGSPHLGVPIERGVELAAAGLEKTPESKPIAEFLNQRSAGIKDLRYGSAQPDSDHNMSVDFHFVAGAVTTEPGGFIGKIIGDLVVPVASATGLGKKRTVSSDSVRVMGGRNHRALLHDQAIHQEILGWLTAEAP